MFTISPRNSPAPTSTCNGSRLPRQLTECLSGGHAPVLRQLAKDDVPELGQPGQVSVTRETGRACPANLEMLFAVHAEGSALRVHTLENGRISAVGAEQRLAVLLAENDLSVFACFPSIMHNKS